MAGQKAFDIDLAIEKAMQLFWQRGYERTSLNDLLEYLDISRSSFYNAFNDKRTLFISVLKRYEQAVHDVIIIQTLRDHESGWQGIQRVFELVVDSLATDEAHRGCLLVNTAVEIASSDEAVASILSENALRCENAIADALRRAQETGEIAQEIDIQATARFLLSTIRGMRVTGRMSHERTVFEDIAKAALEKLAC